jgi:hypothetical protein
VAFSILANVAREVVGCVEGSQAADQLGDDQQVAASGEAVLAAQEVLAELARLVQAVSTGWKAFEPLAPFKAHG